MIIDIAAGIILAAVVLVVGLIVLANMAGFVGDLLVIHQIRQRDKRTSPSQEEPEPEHQSLAEWERANLRT
jgi:hypothetical protein